MKKISEHSLEQYIRFSYELSPARRDEIKRAIRNSEELQQIYNFLKVYYKELDQVSVVQANVFPLQPMQYEKRKAGRVVLAAMTSSPKNTALLTRATLVSKECKTLVRVLENEIDQSLQFHIISEKDGQNERAILSLVNPDIDLVTDDFGKLKGVRNLSDIDWESISSVLRVPVLKLAMDLKTATFPSAGNSNIQMHYEGKKIEVSVEKCDKSYSRILLVQKGYTELQVITTNKVVFDLEINDVPFTLYFYE